LARVTDIDLRKLLALSVERAIWIAAVAALAGGLLIVWASTEDGATSTVLTNFGTAIMTVGLVGVLYDLLMRRILVAEVLKVVGVRESVQAFGLTQIAEHAEIPLERLLADAAEVLVLPLDPLQWVEQDFAVLRRIARYRPLKVTLLLPAKDSPYVRVLAERLGKSETRVEAMLDQAAAGHLGDIWESEPVHTDAQLSVKRFSGLPATGLLMTDQVVAIDAGPLIRFRQLDREDFTIVTERAKTPLTPWVEAQIAREERDENLSSIDQRPLSKIQPPGSED
jgi:hypothetical protein